MKNKNSKTYEYLINKAMVIENTIFKFFEDKFGAEATDKMSVTNSYYKLYLRNQILSEKCIENKYLLKKTIEMRETNWDSLCYYVNENFSKENSELLIYAYKQKSKVDIELDKLASKNPFKKLQVILKERKDAKNFEPENNR